MLKEIIVTVCLLAVLVSGYPHKRSTEIVEYEVQGFSPSAQARLRKAALMMIKELCLDEEPEQEILDKICKRAVMTQLGKKPTPNKRYCMDCDLADPVCFNGCPQ